MNAVTPSLDPISTSIRPTKQDADQRYRYQRYIDGAFVDPAGGQWLETSDPVSGEDWAWVPRGDAREGGIAGIKEYMETKSVWISTATDMSNPFIRR